jgi:effector-binding domain-containing protein
MVHVTTQEVSVRKLAAVHRRVKIGEVGSAWRPALDQVWSFLRAHPGLRTDGHNIFLYHHPSSRNEPMDVDFGVEVTRDFEAAGDVRPTATPAGMVAMAVHLGAYDRLRETHAAIHEWRARTGRSFAGTSWEIYGDWSDDPTQLETTVCYLLGDQTISAS